MTNRGFTIMEFIVVLTIFVIMAGVTLFNFKSFQSDIALSNLAYDIALTLRRAQVVGSSGVGQGNKTSVRGIHFEKDSGTAFRSELIFFQDTGSSEFDFDSDDKELEIFTINTNDTIRSICLAASGDESSCLTETGGELTNFAGEDVSISFERPDPNAYIKEAGVSVKWGLARITIQSPDPSRQLQFVDIYSSGLISIP